jgi:hypothetical protein
MYDRATQIYYLKVSIECPQFLSLYGSTTSTDFYISIINSPPPLGKKTI